MRLALVVIAVALAATSCTRLRSGAVGKAVFYVALDGNDAWSGRLAKPAKDGSDGPLATVTGARDAIRRLRAAGEVAGPIEVRIRGGVYRIGEPIVFGPEDGGTARGAGDVHGVQGRDGDHQRRAA